MPIEKTSDFKKHDRQIPIGKKFSPNKSSAVYLKTTPPRSCLTWKATGRIFSNVLLRWIPTGTTHGCLRWIPRSGLTWKATGRITSKVDNEPTHGSNVDIPYIHACKQTLDISAGIPTADMIVMIPITELESLFDPLLDEYVNGECQVVSKTLVANTANASDKHQQQPNSTLSTLTLATTVTADGIYHLTSDRYFTVFIVMMEILLEPTSNKLLTERQLLAGRLNMLFRDRRTHAYTRLLMKAEAGMSREAWTRATDASDLVHGEVISLRTTVLGQISEIRELQAADHRRQTVISELLRLDHRRSTETSESRTTLQRQITSLKGQVTALQAQVATLQGQQGLARDSTRPEPPEEAGGSA
nr:hypothetical protein [Tanacetum cinerariifolium]